MEGRYRFTLAHEGGGHRRLHRGLLHTERDQEVLFADTAQPAVVCRSSQDNKRLEWQADFYASCLLMPRRLVHAEWQDRLSRNKPLLVSDLRPNNRVMLRAETLIRQQGRGEAEAVDDALLESVAEPIARRFGVSRIAMRIRLEKLGLMVREEPVQHSMTGIM
jgi:Zn-dependent peptidase ImmA (M78 family)